MNSYLIALLVALPFLIGTVSAIESCTTDTHCEDGYYCCRSNLYCCPYSSYSSYSSYSTDSNGGLSAGQIAGIVLGCIAVLSFLGACAKKQQQPRRRVATVPQPKTSTVSHVQLPMPDYRAQQGDIPPPDFSAQQGNVPPPSNSAQEGNMLPPSNSAQHEMHHPPQPVFPPPPAQ
ncbi:hypothetical protein ACF0H5_017158 [Mactra antiquata]